MCVLKLEELRENMYLKKSDIAKKLGVSCSAYARWDNDSIRNYEVTIELSTADFCQKLNIDCKEIVINKQIKDDSK